MRRALVQIQQQPEPRYYDFMLSTIEALSAEDPTLLQQKTPNDFLCQTAITPLGIGLVEGYMQLLAFGYIVPAPQGNDSPNSRGIRVTETGRQWAAGRDEPVPEDQTGFLGALTANVPNLDSVLQQYAQEAVAAYNRRLFFASAVMIGAASEKAVYLLMDAIINSVADSKEQRTLRTLFDQRKIERLLAAVSKKVEDAKRARMPYEVHEGADRHLVSLLEAIRVQRNDAVHPQASRVKPETVRLTLSAFPGACKKVYDLIGWFGSNRI
jgi:hypothetical protein